MIELLLEDVRKYIAESGKHRNRETAGPQAAAMFRAMFAGE